MNRHFSILNAAADGVLRLRTRSLVLVLCLAGILSPFLIATAIFEGIKADSAVSLEEGADLYVSLNKAGRNAPIPVTWADEFRRIPGVVKAVPRIVGRDFIVGPVVIVGLPPEEFPKEVRCIEGSLPASKGEALLGKELARELNLSSGKSFTMNVNPGLRFRVAGLFTSSCPLWSTRLVFVHFEAASELFGMEGEATEILLSVRSGYMDAVYEKLAGLSKIGAEGGKPLRVVSRRIAKEMFRRGFSRRAGVFAALYLIAFALAIPSIAVASGLGFSERRREVGLYRASGWQTVEVLEMVIFENLILSVAGATLALLVSILWMKLANGFFIAQFFLPEVGVVPGFEVTTRFLPLPALLAYLVGITLTMVGSLYYTYRTATIPPMEAIQ
jgi:ABC-type lipoprotein release transport system permease subunit